MILPIADEISDSIKNLPFILRLIGPKFGPSIALPLVRKVLTAPMKLTNFAGSESKIPIPLCVTGTLRYSKRAVR